MCSIVAIEGNFKGNHLIELLKSSKNRGIDSTGIFLDGNIYFDIDLNNIFDDYSYNIGLGHNLLSIFNLNNKVNCYQPLKSENLTLVYNGEIYNFKELADFLKSNSKEKIFLTDSNLLISLLEYFYNRMDNLLDAVKLAIPLLDGDYSFCVYDGNDLVAARDPLGVKPLFYGSCNDFNVISSSKYSLEKAGIEDIRSLKPNEILCNWQTITLDNIAEKKVSLLGDLKSQLEELIKSSVLKRVCYLDEIAVIFSGGVDSTILVLLLCEIAKSRPLEIKLYAVGSEKSKDVIAAREIAEYFNLPLKVHDVDQKIVEDNLEDVQNAICDDSIMKLGVGMTIYLASKMIHDDGGRVAISGQGADELFGGYNRYLKSYADGTLEEELRHDIENMYHVNLERDDAVSMANSVELRLPFLDKKLVEFALNVPAQYKIADGEDKIRKNILRDLAKDLGLPDKFAYRPKKAAQYGTGIDKILRKKIFRN